MEEPNSIEIKRKSQKSFAFHLKNDSLFLLFIPIQTWMYPNLNLVGPKSMVELCHQTIGLSIWQKEKRKENK